MAYSDVEKLTAIEIVRRNGGRLDILTIAEIQAILGKAVSAPTIRGWLKQEKSEKENFREEKKELSSESVQVVIARKLDEKLELAANKFVDHAMKDEVVLKMGGREAMTAAGIAIDKMQLLRNLPTQIIDLLPSMGAVYEMHGSLAIQAFLVLLQRLREANVNHD